jgi:hypothetical protein
MTAPYLFGFPSSIKGISFPGKPRIITAEVQGITVNPGNYSYNGESFTFSAAQPVGPHNNISGIGLVPGTAGHLGLPTFKGLNPPAIVRPFSTDMMNRLYAWQQPVPGYISGDGTTGAAVLFLDIDNVALLTPKAKNYSFSISTGSHGSSTPPGPPGYSYFMYLPVDAVVSGPGPTQTFMDITGNWGGNDPTNPYQMSTYGQELFSGNSMYFPIGASVGPGIPANVYPTLFGSQAELNAWITYVTVGFPSPPFPSGQGPGPNYPWKTPAPITYPAENVGGFAWQAAPVPPPGSAECSWTIKVRSWRRANSFAVSNQGAITNVTLVGSKGKQFAISPIETWAVNSNGGNPPACANTISVMPASMRLSVTQKFS